MKKIIILLGIGWFVHSSFAQTTADTAYSFTAQQAIGYALQHQNNVKNAIIEEEIAHYKVNEVKEQGLPQINGSFDFKDLLIIPTQVLPADQFNPSAPPGTLNAVQFGLQYQGTAAIDFSQLLFSNDYLLGLKASKVYEDLSIKSTERTKIETSATVSKAYYTVLINGERAKLMDANIARLKKAMEDTKVLYENGFAEKIDYDRLTVTYNNLLVEKEKLQRFLDVSRYLLKFQMGMPINVSLTLTDRLEDIQFDLSSLAAAPEKFDYSKRVEYNLYNTQFHLAELDFKQKKMAYLPKLVLYGFVGSNAYRAKFDIYVPSEPWYGNIFVAAKLTMPLFAGLSGDARKQQANLKLMQSENNLEFIKSSIDLELATSATTLKNAATTLEDKKKYIEIAEEVVRISKLKYEQGVGTNLELVSDETALVDAQTNYYSALFDAIVAKIDFDKANGNIK